MIRYEYAYKTEFMGKAKLVTGCEGTLDEALAHVDFANDKKQTLCKFLQPGQMNTPTLAEYSRI